MYSTSGFDPGEPARDAVHQVLERFLPAGGVYAVTCGHRVIVCLHTPMVNGGAPASASRAERLVEGGAVLGLLGFYDELDDRSGQPSGSIRDAVRSVGEQDEADLVAYLDAGHVLINVMEAGRDVITGSTHRHSPGCSSLVTDGTWLWRQDFPHYLETHHVTLPETFLERVRSLNYQMPGIAVAQFAPHYDEAMPLVRWASAVP